jgi:hypothetical protein
MSIATVAPVGQLLDTWYCTEHELAACACVAPMTASVPALSAMAAARADRRPQTGRCDLVEGVVAMGLLTSCGEMIVKKANQARNPPTKITNVRPIRGE